MDMVELPTRQCKDRPALPRIRNGVLALMLLTFLVGVLGASGALGSTPETHRLTGEVINDKKPKNGDPGSKNFSNIALRSGSHLLGKLALRSCNGLAINELICSGKVTLAGFGSGLEVFVRWPCEIVGESGKFTCASVGEGFISSKKGERGTIRIGTAQSNLFKRDERFPVTIRSKP